MIGALMNTGARMSSREFLALGAVVWCGVEGMHPFTLGCVTCAAITLMIMRTWEKCAKAGAEADKERAQLTAKLEEKYRASSPS